MVFQGLLLRCAQLVEEIGRLPGAPSPDWCDRAARTLHPLAPSGVVVVCLADTDEGAGGGDQSIIRDVSAIGAWATVPERAHLAMRRVQRPGLSVALTGRVLTQALIHSVSLRDLATGDLAQGSHWSAAQTLGASKRTTLIVHIARSMSASNDQGDMALAQTAFTTLANFASAALPSHDGSIRWLTRRESEVLEQLVLGYSIREIAEQMGLSHHTVQDHVKHLHTKLEANNRGELVARALGRRPAGKQPAEPADAEVGRS